MRFDDFSRRRRVLFSLGLMFNRRFHGLRFAGAIEREHNRAGCAKWSARSRSIGRDFKDRFPVHLKEVAPL